MRIATAVRILAATLAVLALNYRAEAHHAFAAEFDASRPVQLSGTVDKVVWLNPHARFFMRVTPPNSRPITWELVLGSPNVLIRQGWDRYTIKQGDAISVNGYAARDGSHLAIARSVRLPNKRTLVFGSTGDGGPER